MAFEKLLILESIWSENDITDTRETKKIYSSLETLFSLHDEPIRIIQRPLLSSLYIKDIDNFVSLEANKRGPNVIIMSAHGSHKLVDDGDSRKHRRKLIAFDGPVNISKDIQSLFDKLNRTIFILDACEVGDTISSFRKASGALGAIGFSKTVSWVDSAVFVLALLLTFQTEGVFHLQRVNKRSNVTSKPEKILHNMEEGTYKTLMNSMGVQYSFASS
jgi:hypothetical protein